MARNHKFFFDNQGSPKARGPASEKVLMTFLEVDVQGSDHICRDLMDDVTAIEDESDDLREFVGNAHTVTIAPTGVVITVNLPDAADSVPTQDAAPQSTRTRHTGSTTSTDSSVASGDVQTPTHEPYHVALKHFREVLEDWEAFILDDQIDDPMGDEDYV